MSATVISVPRNMLAAALVGCSLAAVAIGPAHAAHWYIAGSGCAVDRVTVAANNYQQFGVGVEFRPGFIGTIRLFCPVTVAKGILQGSGYKLDVYHQDQNAPGARVFARFNKMHLGTGIVTGVEGCDFSDSLAVADPDFANINKICTHSFNPDGYLYFVEVVLTRTTASAAVRFYGLSIYK